MADAKRKPRDTQPSVWMRRAAHPYWLALCLLACNPYDPALINGAHRKGDDGGYAYVPDSGSADASASDASALDAGPGGCESTQDPNCPTRCPETCNGQDDDCDGLIDEEAERPICKLAFANAVCANAQCLIASCEAGHVDCDNAVDNGCEATLDSLDHCGSCDHACALENGASRCSSGSCEIDSCASGFADCDHNAANGCERPLNTISDCGACGQTCSAAHATTSCETGSCAFQSCQAGFGDCNGDAQQLGGGDGCETDLGTPDNCGACGHKCTGSTPYCSGGKCTAIVCPAGTADCDGDNQVCETNLNSLSNCGTCGFACGTLANADVSCTTGTCMATCQPGFGDCDNALANGCETDLHTNTNCGSCGTTCAYANATSSCADGNCQLVSCASGYGDCNQTASDGCERRLNTNSDCGQCGTACSLANASSTCSSGSCQVSSCQSGFGNCDGKAYNGCEVNLSSSSSNCGACGQVCPNGQTCQSSHCVCTSDQNCSSGQICCGGQCVDPKSDEANCGACGQACGSGQTCCSGSCKSTSTDINNCGSCGNRCGSNSNRCTNGQCRCANDSPCGAFSVCCSYGCQGGLLCF